MLNLSEKPYECKSCGTKFGWLESHDSEQCTAIQLRQALAENAKLKARLASWIDAWYKRGDIIGRLAWSMPQLMPDIQTPFFQLQWKRFVEAVNKYFPEKYVDLPKEETVRTYVDPFDNIEE